MGNCIKSKDKKREELNPPQVEEKKEDPNRRQGEKKRLPLVDNRMRQSFSNEAGNAIVTNSPKSPQDCRLIEQALSAHLLFQSLPKENHRVIIDGMKLFTYEAKSMVCEQGMPGQYFFIVAQGRLDVIIEDTVRSTLEPGCGCLLYTSDAADE